MTRPVGYGEAIREAKSADDVRRVMGEFLAGGHRLIAGKRETLTA